MPDTTELEMPGSSSSGGIPQGVMIVGAIAGIVGLVLLLRNSGGGTTAAGTSINAALGSIQEENMNLLGTTQAGFMGVGQQIGGLSTQMGAGFTDISNQFVNTNALFTGGFKDTQDMITSGFLNTQGQIGGLGTQISSGFTNTNGILQQFQHDVAAQLTAFSGQSQANYTSLLGLIQSGQASQAQIDQQHTALLQSLQQDVTSGLVGINQANSALASVESELASIEHTVSQPSQLPEGTFVKSWDPIQGIYGIGIIKNGVLNHFSSWDQFLSAGGNAADIGNYATISYSAYASQGTAYKG